MKTLMLGLLAETSIHPGAGKNLGAVDLPVAREAATDYPVLVGSSLKGALKDMVRGRNPANQDLLRRLFGEREGAGHLLVSDGRLLLLPVRSLTGQYRWITCPYLLERLLRDRRRVGLNAPAATNTVSVRTEQALGIPSGRLFLEEREFTVGGTVPDWVVSTIEALIGVPETRGRVKDQLVLLHDDDFAYFARYGLAVQARNVLDEKKKTSNNLWYEETLPPDTLMYALLAEREPEAVSTMITLFNETPYLQAGGNETVGQGFFCVRVVS